jgi:hypothetical protein
MGHGNPMNASSATKFTRINWIALGKTHCRGQGSILMRLLRTGKRRGTPTVDRRTRGARGRSHGFHNGLPAPLLFEVRYPGAGANPRFARRVAELVVSEGVAARPASRARPTGPGALLVSADVPRKRTFRSCSSGKGHGPARTASQRSSHVLALRRFRDEGVRLMASGNICAQPAAVRPTATPDTAAPGDEPAAHAESRAHVVAGRRRRPDGLTRTHDEGRLAVPTPALLPAVSCTRLHLQQPGSGVEFRNCPRLQGSIFRWTSVLIGGPAEGRNIPRHGHHSVSTGEDSWNKKFLIAVARHVPSCTLRSGSSWGQWRLAA